MNAFIASTNDFTRRKITMDNRFSRRVLAALTALASFAVHAEETPAEAAKKYATGGEVANFRFVKGGVGHTAFVHTFTNTTEVAKFKNRFGRNLPVRILAVGGGAAGMDGIIYDNVTDLRPGGGGGGGGGVTEMMVSLTSGDELSIRVGAGGGILSHQYGNARGTAGASSISNGTEEVVLVPGGGAGGGGLVVTYVTPMRGAAGGGGSYISNAAEYADRINGASGEYKSSVLNAEGVAVIPDGAPFSGGNGGFAGSGVGSYGGGGGGAGANGVANVGGIGLVSDITGLSVVYGSGGGGGGTLRLAAGKVNCHSEGGEGGLNAGRGGKVTWTVVEDDGAVVTNVYLTAATMPVANTGSGGAGGVSLRHDGANIYVDEVKSDVNTKAYYATRGADGVVVIRYDIPDAPCVGGDVLTAITNGFNVTYIHMFTNTKATLAFKPSFLLKDASVNLRVLAVGGGGAGMDGVIYNNVTDLRPGGGGGGGGGVTEKKVALTVGEELSIRVGAGGRILDRQYGKPRGAAESSSISNGTEEVVLVPGGGAGGGGLSSTFTAASEGAAGGGGSSIHANNLPVEREYGASGVYASSVLNGDGVAVVPEGAPFKGGNGSASASGSYGGGGGGAGAEGVAKTGGAGLASDITGMPVVYGSGGGGGGTLRFAPGKATGYSEGGVGGANAGGGGNVTWTIAESDGAVVTNIYLTAATMPVSNTGSGGAGGVSLKHNGANIYVGDTLVDENTTARYATPGADGVVIIRYDAVLDHPLGTVIVVR